MARRRRRSSEQSGRYGDDGGSLRWVLTYADMITLLLAFVIMLYSMSILNLNKFRQVAISIRSGFSGVAKVKGQPQSVLGNPGAFTIISEPIVPERDQTPVRVMNKLQKIVKEQGLQKMVKIRKDERGVVVSLVTDKAIFPRGRADMTPITRKAIEAISGPLEKVENSIRVEGHTCDLPIQSGQYPSNWELSTARAAAVVRYLIEDAGISPDRLSASGYADSKPLAPNTCESNRAINRRVDIIIQKTGQSTGER